MEFTLAELKELSELIQKALNSSELKSERFKLRLGIKKKLEVKMAVIIKDIRLTEEMYSEREIDFAYLAGVFNVSGIDGLHEEIIRLKKLGKNPHDIILSAR